ncbi:NAD(+) diphosphatase [Acidaminococcus timonensis]|uniref:NAD(+) diphosphatase n=1 Tax=Acidaminococcus timonensis TaxID=1871002 RepID=UPI0008DA2021|nr:NUDIX domain-containing protein [Acidaminococcus timonensis]
MHFTYCPQCGEKLQPRPAGDEGLVPYCNTCKRYWFDWFYRCSIILVCNEYDEVVLCKQPHLSKEYESITSGFIKPGETAEETARREVQEELGLTVDKLVAEGTYWFGKGQMLMHGFLGFVRKQAFHLSKEVSSAHWVPILELPKTAYPETPENVIYPLWRKLKEIKGIQG